MRLALRMRNIRMTALQAVFNESIENHIPQIWAIGFWLFRSNGASDFGDMVPLWDRCNLSIIFQSSLSFLIDSPFRSIRCEELTSRSRIASAIVPSPMMSYHAETGICEAMTVAFCWYRSSMISSIASLSWLSIVCRPKSSSISKLAVSLRCWASCLMIFQ